MHVKRTDTYVIREIHIGNRETCILKWLSLPSGVRKTQFAVV